LEIGRFWAKAPLLRSFDFTSANLPKWAIFALPPCIRLKQAKTAGSQQTTQPTDNHAFI
jgi:hypothetical protein